MDVRKQIIASKIIGLCRDFEELDVRERIAQKTYILVRDIIDQCFVSYSSQDENILKLNVKLLVQTRTILRTCDAQKCKIKHKLLKLKRRAKEIQNVKGKLDFSD